jgi:uncharacterized protein (DUF1684 family)
MKECREFIDRRSPKGIRVSQPVVGLEWTELIYPDVPCFLRDGQSFVFHSSSGPQICYLGKKVRTRRLFSDGKPGHFVITFDGRFAYYTEKTDRRGGSLALFRKDLDTFRTEKLFQAAGKLPGSKLPVSRFSRIQTVSSDNRRVATTGCCLGGRAKPTGPFGILVIDLDSGRTRIAAQDPDFGNPHVQYCRAPGEEASHDLMIQMNHSLAPSPGALGVDAHVVRDDGAEWRNLPWGRDGKESLIGHQIWRGNTRAGVTVTLENKDTSYGWADGTRQDVVAGWPVKAARDAHTGRRTRGASRARVELSNAFSHARFCHLCTDATGLKFALDTFPIFDGERAGMQVFFAHARDERRPLKFTYLLNSHNTFTGKNLHAHPILSPDGTMLLFNSAVSGMRQFYLVTGFNQ